MYQVQHYRKIKTAVGVMNVAAHNMRQNIYDKEGNEIANEQTQGQWYDPEMGKYNRYSGDSKTPAQVLKARADRIQSAELARKPQKNAAYAIEGIFSASHEWNQGWKDSEASRDSWNNYLDKSQEWAEEKFGKDNVLHVAVHMDEKTPHMHVLFTPIIERDGVNRYSSSQFLGGRAGLNSLQTEYHKEVGMDHGLERGKEWNRTSHKTLKEMEHNKQLLNGKEPEYTKYEEKRNIFQKAKDLLIAYHAPDGSKRKVSRSELLTMTNLINAEKYAKDMQYQRDNLKNENWSLDSENSNLKKEVQKLREFSQNPEWMKKQINHLSEVKEKNKQLEKTNAREKAKREKQLKKEREWARSNSLDNDNGLGW